MYAKTMRGKRIPTRKNVNTIDRSHYIQELQIHEEMVPRQSRLSSVRQSRIRQVVQNDTRHVQRRSQNHEKMDPSSRAHYRD